AGPRFSSAELKSVSIGSSPQLALVRHERRCQNCEHAKGGDVPEQGARPSTTWGVLRIGLVAEDQESGMKWRVVVELAGADGAVQSHEISVGGCGTIDHSAETLGLTLVQGKKTLAGLQRHLVQAQTEEHCRNRRR